MNWSTITNYVNLIQDCILNYHYIHNYKLNNDTYYIDYQNPPKNNILCQFQFLIEWGQVCIDESELARAELAEVRVVSVTTVQIPKFVTCLKNVMDMPLCGCLCSTCVWTCGTTHKTGVLLQLQIPTNLFTQVFPQLFWYLPLQQANITE